jgi:DNA-binding protein H-NS
MTTLAGLLAKRAEIDKLIDQTQRETRAAAIAQVRALLDEYGLTVADIGGKAPSTRAPKQPGTKVAAKYRDIVTCESWSCRGLQPKWLKAAIAAGKKLEDFAV